MNRFLLILLALLLQPATLMGLAGSYYRGIPVGTLDVAGSSPSYTAPVIKNFAIIVGRTGFNGTADQFIVQVNEGDDVRITFLYGDGDLSWDNPHEVTIQGYGIKTTLISKTNPSVTVEFVAGQSGRFSFYCSVPCQGMENLQGGVLEVKPSGATPTVTTNLSIIHCHVHQSSLLHTISHLADEQNNPLRGVIVRFYVLTTFGYMQIGTNTTDTQGYAAVLTTASSGVEVVASSFNGSGIYMPSNATAAVQPSPPGPILGQKPPYLSGENLLVDLRLVGVEPVVGAIIVSMVILTIGGVWSAYAYVVGQILKIKRYTSKNIGGG